MFPVTLEWAHIYQSHFFIINSAGEIKTSALSRNFILNVYYFRYNYSRDKMLTAQIQEGMRLNALFQGTDLERQIRDEFLEETKDP